jgi:hypothetical protein
VLADAFLVRSQGPRTKKDGRKERATLTTIQTLLSCKKSNGRDSGFALARPVLESRMSRVLACYMGEPDAGDRHYGDVVAGPLAEQECAAKR